MNVLAVAVCRELDGAGGQGVERVILADAHVEPGVKFGAPLADQNVACENGLAAEFFDAETLRIGIAAIAGRAGALFRGEKLEIE